jgi:TolA-binding protein
VVKNYPKSPKAPDAMFKVGVIMQDKGDTAKAKAVYQQVVSKFPGTDGAKQAQKRLNALDDYGMTRNRIISGLVA